jgi:plastocyanin
MARRFVLAAAAAALALPLVVGSATAAKGVVVKAAGVDFSPKKVEVDVNEKVTWKGKEGKHTVTVIDTNIDKVLKEGDKVSLKFDTEGTVKYYCRPHEDAGMKGKVIVGN